LQPPPPGCSTSCAAPALENSWEQAAKRAPKEALSQQGRLGESGDTGAAQAAVDIKPQRLISQNRFAQRSIAATRFDLVGFLMGKRGL
jgi:hypothetical protein